MSLAMAKKALVALLFALGAAAALLFRGYDPSFTQAVIALVGPVFAVVGVFLSKNHSVDDLGKAVAQLQGAALYIVGYFAVVPTDTGQKVGVLAGAIVSVIAVWWTTNDASLPDVGAVGTGD